MCTFFVHVDDAPSREIETFLMPLVQAANGGQNSKACGESTVDLLKPVGTDDLDKHFEKLASFVNLEKCVLESRLSLVKAQEKEMRAKSSEELKGMEKLHREQVHSLNRATKLAEKSMKMDQKKMQDLFDSMVDEMQQEVFQLESGLDNANGYLLKLETEYKKKEAEYLAAKARFDQDEEAFKQTCAILSEMCVNQAKQLQKVSMQQAHFLEQFGTTDVKLLMAQLQSLRQLKSQVKHSCVIEEDTCPCRPVAVRLRLAKRSS